MHENSLANLKKFQKGQSGNPGGLSRDKIEQIRRSRDKAMDIEEKMLDAIIEDITKLDSRALEHLRGDVLRLIHTAIERHDGKPTQKVDNTSSDGSVALPTRVILVGPDQ